MTVNDDDTENAAKPSRSEKLVSWFVEKLLAGLILAGVGFGLGRWSNSSAPHVGYLPGEVLTFAGEKEAFGVFTTTLTNDGSKRAENVRCAIDLGECEIQDLKAEPEFLHPQVTFKAGKAEISLDSLNPHERVDIAIKASKPNEIAKFRKIRARANDIVAVEITPNSSNQFWNGVAATMYVFMVVAAVLAYLMLASAIISVRKARKRVAARRAAEPTADTQSKID